MKRKKMLLSCAAFLLSAVILGNPVFAELENESIPFQNESPITSEEQNTPSIKVAGSAAFAAALNALQGGSAEVADNGATVKLLKDIDLGDKCFHVTAGTTESDTFHNFDLNGHVVQVGASSSRDSVFSFELGANDLNIWDHSENKSGKLDTSARETFAVNVNGTTSVVSICDINMDVYNGIQGDWSAENTSKTLNLKNINVKAANQVINYNISSSGSSFPKVNIEDCTMTTANAGLYDFGLYFDGVDVQFTNNNITGRRLVFTGGMAVGTLTFNSGTLSATGENCVCVDFSSGLVIKDGTFSAEGASAVVLDCTRMTAINPTISIEGGTFTSKGTAARTIGIYGVEDVSISGGSFENTAETFTKMRGTVLNITGSSSSSPTETSYYNASLTITGNPTFTANGYGYLMNVYGEDDYSATVEIDGGTYTGNEHIEEVISAIPPNTAVILKKGTFINTNGDVLEYIPDTLVLAPNSVYSWNGCGTPSFLLEDYSLFTRGTLTILENTASPLILSQTGLMLMPEETTVITPFLSPSNQGKKVTWISTDPAVATVSNGSVTAVSQGTTTIIAKIDEQTSASCTVAVKGRVSVTGITLDQNTLDLKLDKDYSFTATVEPNDATNKNVLWSVSDSTLAEIDSRGNFRPKQTGSVIVTATTMDGGFSANCTVNITGTSLQGVSLIPANKSLSVGESFKLKAQYTPSDAMNKVITWQSSNPAVASVRNTTSSLATEIITALSPGTAVISIVSQDGGHRAECVVTVTGGSGGNIDSGSPPSYGGSSTPSTPVGPVVPPADSKEPTSAVANTTIRKDGSGAGTATVSKSAVSSAIKKAESAAEKNNVSGNGIDVIVHLKSRQDLENLRLTLPQNVQKELIDSNVKGLKIVSDDMTVSLDEKALTHIEKAAGGDVTLHIDKLSADMYATNVQNTLENRPVYDIRLNTSNGNTLSAFDGGQIKISVPYVPAINEQPERLVAVYVHDDTMTYLAESKYDVLTGTLNFSTNHLSSYGIAYINHDGWIKNEKQWLYFSSGLHTGWLKENGRWYYLNQNGIMQTGWVYINQKWYYLDSSGAMKKGWSKVDNKWYYLYADGSLAISTTTPDGYLVDQTGVWIN